jgi:penicillin-binding protein 1C
LANSLNISAVKVLASAGGSEPLQQLLQQCGLTTLSQPAETYGLGLTLGNAEARLLELANAYACLARLGDYQPYRLVMASPPGTPHRVADSASAYLIADILSDNDARSLAFGAESSLRFDFPVACKTGTSSDFRDNWAFGYTPEFTVGVWVGNFDGTPMQHVSGVTGAAPLLHDIIEHLHSRYGTSWYSMPTNVVECWVHAITGKRLEQLPIGANSPGANLMREAFGVRGIPALLDAESGGMRRSPNASRARLAPLDSSSEAVKEKFNATNLPPLESPADYADAPAPKRNPGLVPLASGSSRRLPVLLGSEYREWLAGPDNWLGDRAVLAPEQDSLRIIFPLPGTTVYLDPDLPHQGRRLFVRAEGSGNLEWQSDSLQFFLEGSRQISLLTEGRHQISVRDPETGQAARTWINVLAR